MNAPIYKKYVRCNHKPHYTTNTDKLLTQQQLIERMQNLLKDTLSPFGLYPDAKTVNKLQSMKLEPIELNEELNRMQSFQSMQSIEVQTHKNSGEHSPLCAIKSKSGYQSVLSMSKYCGEQRAVHQRACAE